jgi:membrane-bound lytic murein transglycosylase B
MNCLKLYKPLKLGESFVLVVVLLLPVHSLAGAGPAAGSAQRKAAAAKKKEPVKVESATQETTAATAQDADVERITVEELKDKIAKNEPITIIDDRSQGSYEASEIQIKGSIRITVDEIQSRLKEIPRDREIVTYCT